MSPPIPAMANEKQTPDLARSGIWKTLVLAVAFRILGLVASVHVQIPAGDHRTFIGAVHFIEQNGRRFSGSRSIDLVVQDE